MPEVGLDARRSRRWVVTSALAIAAGLAGAAVVICLAARDIPAGQNPPAQAVTSAQSRPSDWSTLPLAEQRALAPLKASWGGLDPTARARWAGVARRLQSEPPGAAAHAAKYMDSWQRMSPAARAKARLRYVLASKVPAAERRMRWHDYLALSHPERRPDASAKPALRTVLPGLVQDRVGATTVLLTDILPGASSSGGEDRPEADAYGLIR